MSCITGEYFPTHKYKSWNICETAKSFLSSIPFLVIKVSKSLCYRLRYTAEYVETPLCQFQCFKRNLSYIFSNYQLNAQFFYFSTIYMLHYAPQHVSSNTLLILRRTSCITTASGIVTLCKQPYSMQVESSPSAYSTAAYRGWRYQRLWWYNWSSWGWAACCSKHVEERSVTYILLKNKRILH